MTHRCVIRRRMIHRRVVGCSVLHRGMIRRPMIHRAMIHALVRHLALLGWRRRYGLLRCLREVCMLRVRCAVGMRRVSCRSVRGSIGLRRSGGIAGVLRMRMRHVHRGRRIARGRRRFRRGWRLRAGFAGLVCCLHRMGVMVVRRHVHSSMHVLLRRQRCTEQDAARYQRREPKRAHASTRTSRIMPASM
ncbi:hypothetical protein FHR61_001178 [Xanthomonas arboricola]|uniref:Uncharacterized protein n=1 Tax=Xanthomonas cannabis TaxID=1885674 RepID=A0ABR6JF55_9XANT|nr:hypothetical protein [Xanthomonas cannabis]MBB5521352.1 hypothetical protein [Xanthomonas cannabis]